MTAKLSTHLLPDRSSLGDVGDSMRQNKLRLRQLVDKDGTILYPRQ